ncbi:LegC family aminotransferase [Lacinutrix salivirga]
MYSDLINFIKNKYQTEDFIPLHIPRFKGNEKKYVMDCIDTSFVSSVGEYVNKFEDSVAKFTGAKYAIATVNGTAALHIALLLADVKQNDEVISQPLTFIATANAISYIGAQPVFIDVDKATLGLSPEKLEHFLKQNTEQINGECINKNTNKRIKAVVPMHTFGLPAKIDEIAAICTTYNINLVEDAAESLGSYYKEQHTGTFGLAGTLSFNGNKTITTGGGGMIITNNEALAKKAKHITTTAKVPHSWDYVHDSIGYNYRLPNLNAALGCAQMESLPEILKNKRALANAYATFCDSNGYNFITEPEHSTSNYWLNAIQLESESVRDNFLKITNQNNVMTRPIWKLMNELDMFKSAETGNLDNAKHLSNTIVNVPSSTTII